MAIAELTAAMNGLKAATDLAKALASANTAYAVAELKLKAAEMMTSLADARAALASAQEAAVELQDEITRLNGALEMKASVVRADSAYYDMGESGKPIGDPYCMRCWESDHKLRHLSMSSFVTNPTICPECKTEYDHNLTYRRT
ncbi:hypothetical protein [Rhodanobacter sp. DHG33]|uniref:hypothetical protein n=1 Tax=Rhodanobacter sp. DHG33 TaxID=2775921 RepID=UPI00177F2210|nr:hypothetical protein [Rhodanobacter sp. DHG33]MBD8900011.1 hypothetical protein [Rhodanobacter sp. DHG33]